MANTCFIRHVLVRYKVRTQGNNRHTRMLAHSSEVVGAGHLNKIDGQVPGSPGVPAILAVAGTPCISPLMTQRLVFILSIQNSKKFFAGWLCFWVKLRAATRLSSRYSQTGVRSCVADVVPRGHPVFHDGGESPDRVVAVRVRCAGEEQVVGRQDDVHVERALVRVAVGEDDVGPALPGGERDELVPRPRCCRLDHKVGSVGDGDLLLVVYDVLMPGEKEQGPIALIWQGNLGDVGRAPLPERAAAARELQNRRQCVFWGCSSCGGGRAPVK